MGRVAPLAVALVAVTSGAAWASPTHRVRIETTPEGAHVYLGDVESGAKCETTPCEFDAPVGDDSIILQLDKYQSRIEEITVKAARDKKAQVFQYKLDPAVATIVIEDKRAAGASIQIEGHEKAKVPARVEVDAGGHQVTVKLGNKVLYEDFVDVDAGSEKVIELPAGALGKDVVAAGGDGDGDNGDGDKGDGDKGDGGGSITKGTEPSQERARFISAALVVDVGWRRFHYESPPSGTPPQEAEDGQVIGGPAVEIWPAELLHAQHLRGLSLYGRAEFGINQLNVLLNTGTPMMPVYTTVGQTSWQSYEGSVRQRWTLDSFAIEASAGYAQDIIAYSAPTRTLPSADYGALRAGGRAFLITGGFAPYVSGEARIVLAGGGTLGMPAQASATGIRGAAGFEYVFGPLYTRAEAEYLHYEWTYPTSANPTGASGASDKIFGFSVSAGYQY
ncbi:MAG TPA: PEGA domain-containing protein [Kofleriaceae bacterium]|nr:PEGA domain-containing protein [Kofleriaceae bacterium]